MTTVRSYTATVALTPVRPSASHPIGVINRGPFDQRPITAMVPLTPRPPLRVPLAPGGTGQVGGCEGRVARGVQWPPTLKGETVERPCPKGSLGRCGICVRLQRCVLRCACLCGICMSISRFSLKCSRMSSLWTLFEGSIVETSSSSRCAAVFSSALHLRKSSYADYADKPMAAIFSKKVHYLRSTKLQTHKVSDSLVKTGKQADQPTIYMFLSLVKVKQS